MLPPCKGEQLLSILVFIKMFNFSTCGWLLGQSFLKAHFFRRAYKNYFIKVRTLFSFLSINSHLSITSIICFHIHYDDSNERTVELDKTTVRQSIKTNRITPTKTNHISLLLAPQNSNTEKKKWLFFSMNSKDERAPLLYTKKGVFGKFLFQPILKR